MKAIFHFQIFLSICLLFSHQAKAQLICTNVNPDLTVSTSYTLDVDLDNDLTIDFRIISTHPHPALGSVYLPPNQVGLNNSVMTDSAGFASCLSLNTVIGPSSPGWSQMNTQYLNMYFASPPHLAWRNAIDKYLGLQLAVGTNTYFGWARFTFKQNSQTFVFKDYAYNSVPNQPILAGQGCAPLSSPSFYLDSASCNTQSTTMTANVGSLTASGYTWSSSPAGPVFSALNGSVTNVVFPAAGTFSIDLAVDTNTGVMWVTESVTVFPTPTVIAVANPTGICYLSNQHFTITATGANTFTFLDVSFPMTSWTVGTGPSYVGALSWGGVNNFKIVATTNGCTGEDTLSVHEVAPTEFTVIGTPSVCAGSPATITALQSNLTYSWTDLNNTFTLTGASITVTPSVFPAYYYVFGFDGLCESNNYFVVNEKSISVKAASSSSTSCAGELVKFTASGATNYLWSPPFGLLASYGSTILAAPVAGITYSVIGTDQTCSDTATLKLSIDPCTALNEKIKSSDFRIYPNPVTDKIFIQHSLSGSIVCDLREVTGELLYSFTMGEGENSRSLIHLASGFYFLLIYEDDKLVYTKTFCKVE
jgi:hypothetical protein